MLWVPTHDQGKILVDFCTYGTAKLPLSPSVSPWLWSSGHRSTDPAPPAGASTETVDPAAATALPALAEAGTLLALALALALAPAPAPAAAPTSKKDTDLPLGLKKKINKSLDHQLRPGLAGHNLSFSLTCEVEAGTSSGRRTRSWLLRSLLLLR